MISPLGRREFLGLGALLAVGRAGADAGAPLRLGLVTSQSPLTESIVCGAELGLSEADLFARLFGKRVEILVRSAATDAQTLAVGVELFRREGVAAVVGGTSDASAEVLRNAAREASGLFLNVGGLAGRLRRELFDRRTLHVHPGVETLVNAVGLWLLEQGQRTRFALVLSESALGAEVGKAASALLAGRSARLVLREGLPSSSGDPAAVAGRLRDARPDAILLGLEPDALRAFLDHHREAGLPGELAAVTSDPHFAVTAEPAELAGVWPLVWHSSLERYSARELNARFRRRFERSLDGAAWAAWAAVKLLTEAAVRAESVEAQPLLDFVERRLAFDGHKGAALGFREADRELGQPLYIARPSRATTAGDAGGLEIVAEVSRERLDAVAGPGQERR